MAASELINFDELRTRLLELEETRQSAERELKIIRTHKERVAELEADRDALLTSLKDIAPIALDSLTPEERRRFYKLLVLQVIAYPDRSLEVEFGDGLNVRERETVQGPCSVNVLRLPALRLLASVGAGFLATGGLGRGEVPW